MTIKVLADKILAFDRGDRDKDGNLMTEKTKIGFCTLPDWVAETDYFKMATADGSLKAFTSPGEPEDVLKAQEKLAAINAEIKAAEEKRDMLSNVSDGTVGTTGVPNDSNSGTTDPNAKSVPDDKTAKK